MEHRRRLRKVRRRMTQSFDKMLARSLRSGLGQKGYDQTLLAQYLWPEFGSDAVQHDAYKCKTFGRRGGDMRPFPTQRISGKSETCSQVFFFVQSFESSIN